MPRPRKDAEGPSAQDAMSEAFWKMLELKPYAKISVRDITEVAHVNRNTFYYHYGCMDDLAHQSVKDALLVDIARYIVEGQSVREAVTALFGSDEYEDRSRKISLLVGPHGSTSLVEALKQSAIEGWMTAFDIEREDMTQTEWMAIRFVAAGFVDLLGTCDPEIYATTMLDFAESGFAEDVRTMVTRCFGIGQLQRA